MHDIALIKIGFLFFLLMSRILRYRRKYRASDAPDGPHC